MGQGDTLGSLTGSISYGGSASEPSNDGGGGGNFAIIQMLDNNWTDTSLLPGGGSRVHYSGSGGTVLDNVKDSAPSSTTGLFLNNSMTYVGSGATSSLFGSSGDNPFLPYLKGTDKILCSEVNMDDEFTDYLIYHLVADQCRTDGNASHSGIDQT
jgi:hypothetical protein